MRESENKESDQFQLFIKFGSRETFEISWQENLISSNQITIMDVRRKIYDLMQIPVTKQTLFIFKEGSSKTKKKKSIKLKSSQNSCTLEELGIKNQDEIKLIGTRK